MRTDAESGSKRRAWGDRGPAYGLVLWVLAAVMCALLPLPRVVVDLLLTLSLAGSIATLVASLTVRQSVDLLGFPSLLLLMTLTRMALNVTTTRLILSDADAGRVIEAFATLVIQGDLLVGAVIFAIVTVVQFVVVARGGERIAEVAARFALDGLPGHQAAIEADLRAGSISPAEASRRRARLLERSDFHGRMDGAAKFIRGDAILGLALTAVNLVGGVAVGLREGLGPAAALNLYGRLTIGDGLLAQVPALLIGLAAALLVARVDGEEPRRRRRPWLTPGVLAAPAGLLAGLALAPGMPRAAFLTTAAGLGAAALGLGRGRGRAQRQIVVCLPGHGPEDIKALRRPLAELRRRCAEALGIEVPEIVAAAGPEPAVRLGERLLDHLELEVEFKDIDLRTCSIGQDVEATVVAVFRAVMRGAEALVDLETIEAGLEAARSREPATVREALKAVGPADLLELIRGLLRERVPLPPFMALLEAVAAEPLLRQPEARARWLAALRERLAPHWVREVVAARARLGPLVYARPDPDAEAALLGLVMTGALRLRLRLAEPARQRWHAQVRAARAIGEEAADGEEAAAAANLPPLLVCSPRARPAFALLLARAAPHVTVLSTGELQEVDLPVPGEPGGPPAAWFTAP